MDAGTSKAGDGPVAPTLLSNGITPVQQMISSCSGAVFTSLLVTPFDVVKVRLQAARQPPKMGSCFLCSNGLMDQLHVCMYDVDGSRRKLATMRLAADCKPWYARGGKFNGTFDGFVKIARNEGITSLWSGLPPTLVMAVPATVCYFTLYDNLNAAFQQPHYFGQSSSLAALTAGSIARLSVLTIVSPLEMARTKMQSEQMTYRAFLQSLSASSSRIGWRSTLFKGWAPTALRDVPFSAIYWMSYERLKALMADARLLDNSGTFFKSLCAGALAGSLAASVTLPFDVCKTKRQVEIGEHMIDPKGHKESVSTFACIRQLYRTEGAGALFTGFSPRLIKVAPACAIMIASYEYCKEYFRRHNEARR